MLVNARGRRLLFDCVDDFSQTNQPTATTTTTTASNASNDTRFQGSIFLSYCAFFEVIFMWLFHLADSTTTATTTATNAASTSGASNEKDDIDKLKTIVEVNDLNCRVDLSQICLQNRTLWRPKSQRQPPTRRRSLIRQR